MNTNQHTHMENRPCQNNFILCKITSLVAKWNCVDISYLGFDTTRHVCLRNLYI